MYTSNNFWVVLIGMTFLFIGSASCDPIVIQRSCSLATIKQAKKVIYYSLPGNLLNTTLYTLIGLILYANYYKCDPILDGKIKKADEIVPLFISQIFNSIPGLNGLFIVCVLSASLSTLSSGLNAVATLVWEDILKKTLPKMKPNKSVMLTKIIAATVGLVCIAVAFFSKEFGSIFEAVFALAGSTTGPLFGVFSMGLFLPFVNSYGAIFGLLFGQLLCFIINIGAIMNRAPMRTLLSSNEECVNLNSTLFVPFKNLTNNHIPLYSPEGWNKLFHISYFFIPLIGFLTTIFLGILISVIT
ncbi:sodium-coupled monocarboxylate transporter 2-like protein, partial [Leptotrombidium deliense]